MWVDEPHPRQLSIIPNELAPNNLLLKGSSNNALFYWVCSKAGTFHFFDPSPLDLKAQPYSQNDELHSLPRSCGPGRIVRFDYRRWRYRVQDVSINDKRIPGKD